MEGQVKGRRPASPSFKWSALLLAIFSAAVAAQEPGRDAAQLNLRRSVNTREYQGREIEGTERVIVRGDSLWRILVQEKRVPEKTFHSYLVVMRGLNPQLKSLDVLRVGDALFIPLRPDDALGSQAVPGKIPAAAARAPESATVSYRVKTGESLYRILRSELAISDSRKIASYAELVKDLNPEKRNWDLLQEGEIIRLPAPGGSPIGGGESQTALQAKPSQVESASETRMEQGRGSGPAVDARDPRRLRAQENLAILARVVEALGSQFQSAGEEVVTLNTGTVRIDKSSYPVIYSPTLQQKLVLDPQNKIPAALRTSLTDPKIGMQVIALADQTSVQDAVAQLLAGLGYQSLPGDRPVVIQDGNIAFEAHGDWIVLAPQESNKAQQIHVINLADGKEQTPDYLRSQLALKGLHMQDVSFSSAAVKPAVVNQVRSQKAFAVKARPRDKSDMVDSILFACGVPFGVAETVSVELREGLRVDTRADRTFELGGRRIAVFFQRADPEIKKALQERQATETVELQLGALSSRQSVEKLLNVLGEQTAYREHRFPAADGIKKSNLVLSTWGFLLAKKNIFVTDREIAPPLQRFFFERGLEIVYF